MRKGPVQQILYQDSLGIEKKLRDWLRTTERSWKSIARHFIGSCTLLSFSLGLARLNEPKLALENVVTNVLAFSGFIVLVIWASLICILIVVTISEKHYSRILGIPLAYLLLLATAFSYQIPIEKALTS